MGCRPPRTDPDGLEVALLCVGCAVPGFHLVFIRHDDWKAAATPTRLTMTSSASARLIRDRS